jgi:O-antigen ligase
MIIPLILVYSICFLVLAFKRLDLAVLLTIALLSSYEIRFSVFGIPSTLLEAMIIIVFAVWFFKESEMYRYLRERKGLKNFLSDRKFRMPYPFGAELTTLLIIALISAGISWFSQDALGIYKAYFFESALLYIVVLNVFKDGSGRKIIYALLASAFGVAAIALFQKLSGGISVPGDFWNTATQRATSVYPYPNAVGLFLAPIIMIAMGYGVALLDKVCGLDDKIINILKKTLMVMRNDKEFLAKILFVKAFLIASVLAVIFAKSKGAIFGLAAAFFFFGMLAGKRARVLTISIALFAMLAIFGIAPIRDSVNEKLVLGNLSGEIRKQQWRETWQMLTADPARFVFGAGLSNYQKAIEPFHQEGIFFNKDHDQDFRRKLVLFDDKYKQKYWQPVEIYMYPHNIFLNFWSELGIAGMLLFAWIIGKFFYIGFKLKIKDKDSRKYWVIGLLSSMVAIIIHGLVDVPYFKNDLAVLFWILIALMGMAELEMKNIEAKR